MRPFIIVFVLFGCTSWLFPQTSIGFKNPQDTQALLDYRLPDWGFQTFRMSLGLDASQSKFRALGDSESANQSFDFRPYYYWMKESDEQRFAFQFSSNSDYGFHKNESQGNNNGRISSSFEENRFYNSSHLGTNWKRYFNSDLFGLVKANSNIYFRETDQKSQNSIELEKKITKDLNREYRHTVELGLGWGRLRNISPVIGALRLNERLVELGKSPGLSPGDIQYVAQSIAQIDGYHQRYDRPLKYFWEETMKPITNRHELTPFEIYYLTDIMLERMDQERCQGWYVSTNLRYTNLFHTSSGPYSTNRELRQDLLGVVVEGEWFENLSLYHQLSVQSEFFYGSELRDEPSIRHVGLFSVIFSHLWNINDRFWWRNQVQSVTDYTKSASDGNDFDQHYSFDSNISFFIEDHLSFNVSYYLRMRRENSKHFGDKSTQEEDTWRLGIGLSYYFSRSLF